MKMALDDSIEEFGNNIPKILLNNPIGHYKISFILIIDNIRLYMYNIIINRLILYM